MPLIRQQLSVSQMRALKRSRPTFVPDDECPRQGHFVLKPLPAGPHAPAKKEAQALRRICARTGLSPDQVRERHRYRVELAQAARVEPRTSQPGLTPRDQRMLVQRLKQVQRTARLAHWHPGLKAAFLTDWKNLAGYQRCPGLSGEQAFAHAVLLMRVRRSAQK